MGRTTPFRVVVVLGLALHAVVAMRGWQEQPFDGYLLERHQIVSALHDPGWPAFAGGLRVGDALLAREADPGGQVTLHVRRRGEQRTVTFAPAPFPAPDRWRFLLPWLLLGLLLGALGPAIARVRPDHAGARALSDFTLAVAIFALTNLESVTTRQTWLINQLALGATPALALGLARSVTARNPDGQAQTGPLHPGFMAAGMAVALVGAARGEAAPYAYPALIMGACGGLLAIPVLSLMQACTSGLPSHARRRAATWATGTGLALLPITSNGAGGFLGGAMPVGALATMLLFPLTLGMLLIRDQLFAIDRRSRRVIAHLLATVSLAGVQALLLAFATPERPESGQAWIAAGGGLMVALGIAPLARTLQAVLDRFFDQVSFDPAEVLGQFHAQARNCPDGIALDRLRGRLVDQNLGPVRSIPPDARATLPPRRSGQPWSQRDRQFLADLDAAHRLWHEHLELVATHVRQERVTRELALARDLQRAWTGHPPSLDGRMDLAIRCLPALEVGGDFAEVIHRSDGRWLIAIGDVSGKGVPAALLMAATLTLLRARAEAPEGPAEMLRHLGAVLHRQRPSPAMFVTLSLALLDADRGELLTASAGQREPWIEGCPPGASGIALGWLADAQPPEHRHVLQPGTRVLWATDGLEDGLEAHEETRQDAVGALWNRLPAMPAEALADRLVAATRVADGRAAFDDLTLVVLRWRPDDTSPRG